MPMIAVLADSAAPPSGTNWDWVYVLAAAATIIGGLVALRSAWVRFIQQRQAEAVEKNTLSVAINGNADATRENTLALGKLSADFAALAAETREALHQHDERIVQLEQRRRTPPRRAAERPNGAA